MCGWEFLTALTLRSAHFNVFLRVICFRTSKQILNYTVAVIGWSCLIFLFFPKPFYTHTHAHTHIHQPWPNKYNSVSRVLACRRHWVQSPAQHRTVIVTHAYKPSTWDVEAGGSEIQSHFRLHSKFEASLGYLRPYLRQTCLVNHQAPHLNIPPKPVLQWVTRDDDLLISSLNLIWF